MPSGITLVFGATFWHRIKVKYSLKEEFLTLALHGKLIKIDILSSK
jgi:hypothetical protein